MAREAPGSRKMSDDINCLSDLLPSFSVIFRITTCMHVLKGPAILSVLILTAAAVRPFVYPWNRLSTKRLPHACTANTCIKTHPHTLILIPTCYTTHVASLMCAVFPSHKRSDTVFFLISFVSRIPISRIAAGGGIAWPYHPLLNCILPCIYFRSPGSVDAAWVPRFFCVHMVAMFVMPFVPWGCRISWSRVSWWSRGSWPASVEILMPFSTRVLACW
jgi:hypothetical protein